VWAEGRQLAEVYGECREARAANARLIAAAPELLKALQDIIAEFWAEYEYPDRPPQQSPTVEAIRNAERVIREAKGEVRTNVLSEFSRLCQTRDLAAYRAVAAIQTVVLFWEAQDHDDVLAQLQKALADFKAADARISQFRNSYQGELDRDGHTTSAALDAPETAKEAFGELIKSFVDKAYIRTTVYLLC
jgi:hypothetical protein